jgi:hypothetical protein
VHPIAAFVAALQPALADITASGEDVKEYAIAPTPVTISLCLKAPLTMSVHPNAQESTVCSASRIAGLRKLTVLKENSLHLDLHAHQHGGLSPLLLPRALLLHLL